MHIYLFKLFVVLLFVAPAFGQVPPPDNRPDTFLGAVGQGSYKNEFFQFRLRIPPKMYVLTAGQVATFKATGTELLSADVKGSRAAWEKAASAEVILLSLAENEPGVVAGASLNVGALRQPAGVTSKMVCDVAKDFVLLNPKFKVMTETMPIKLAGKDFSRLELTLGIEGTVVYFRYYATIVRGHSLTFVTTYLKNDELERFEKVLSTLEFFE